MNAEHLMSLFKKFNITPKTGQCKLEDNCGCAVTALAMELGKSGKDSKENYACTENMYGWHFIEGLYSGFDGAQYNERYLNQHEDIREGYLIGKELNTHFNLGTL